MSETIPAKYEADLLLFLEGWHREYLWPKAYFHREAKGGLRLVAEVNSDYEYGATDAQLVQQCMCALATTLQLFRAAGECFGPPGGGSAPPGDGGGGRQRGFDGPAWLPPSS